MFSLVKLFSKKNKFRLINKSGTVSDCWFFYFPRWLL